MKTRFNILAIILVLFLSAAIAPEKALSQPNSVSFQVFYDQLSPYGYWVDYPDYGYVWIPDEGPDFVPYSTAGHWMMTEYGWTWASDYEWGWALSIMVAGIMMIITVGCGFPATSGDLRG